MVKLILVSIFILTTYSSFSQGNLIGIKGGISWSNLSSKELTSGGARKGVTYSITCEGRIKNSFLVGGELSYQQRGHEVSVFWTDESGQLIGDFVKTKNKYDYLGIPIKAGYIVGTKVSGFACIGVVPALLIKAKSEFPEFAKNYGIDMEELDVKEYVQSFDIAGFIEVGGNWQFSERFVFSVSGTYQNSFTTYTNPEYYENANARHYGVLLTGGIKYKLE